MRHWSANSENLLAKLHEYDHNTCPEFQFHVAHQLCDEVGIIFAEDLNNGKCRGQSFLKNQKVILTKPPIVKLAVASVTKIH